MKFFTFLLFGAAVLLNVSAASVVKPHLIGKSEEVQYDYPAIVAVYTKDNLKTADRVLQGAQVFHTNKKTGRKTIFIITAADALHDLADGWSVKVSGLNGDHPLAQFKHLKYKIHPEYNKDTKANNIAIFLPEVSWYHKYLLELPEEDETIKANKMEIVSYASGSDVDDFSSYKLYSMETTEANSLWCNIINFFSPIKATHICTSSAWGGKGFSKEDIGAPLVYRDMNDTLKISGIATLARQPRWYSPTEMTSIKPYLKWIDEEISKFWEK